MSAADSSISIHQLRQKLGRAGLIDSKTVRLVRANTGKSPRVAGATIYGWITQVGNDVVTDSQGRVIISLTDEGLKSLQTAVETVGHELHHLREIRAGIGSSEQAAEAAAREYWELFQRRVRDTGRRS